MEVKQSYLKYWQNALQAWFLLVKADAIYAFQNLDMVTDKACRCGFSF